MARGQEQRDSAQKAVARTTGQQQQQQPMRSHPLNHRILQHLRLQTPVPLPLDSRLAAAFPPLLLQHQHYHLPAAARAQATAACRS